HAARAHRGGAGALLRREPAGARVGRVGPRAVPALRHPAAPTGLGRPPRPRRAGPPDPQPRLAGRTRPGAGAQGLRLTDRRGGDPLVRPPAHLGPRPQALTSAPSAGTWDARGMAQATPDRAQ